MIETEVKVLDELVRAGSMLTGELDFKLLTSSLVEQSIDVTRSDLAALYLHSDPDDSRSPLKLINRRGRFPVPQTLASGTPLVSFLDECREAALILERKASPFKELLLHDAMQSGIGLPVATPKASLGVLFLNSGSPMHYDRKRFRFLDSFAKLAGGMLFNSKLFQDLKDYLRRIEDLERYQESIFSSMTNLLVTTDERGQIRYFNTAAAERLNLTESEIGKDFNGTFKKAIDTRIMKAIETRTTEKTDLLGVEGIYRGESEMDFALNVTPLKGKRGAYEGLTLLFTDQTRERELQGQMKQVVEERRIIKNMFSRYLSGEIVRKLMEAPNLVKLGGDKKESTIFFADIRGYTSFSEGKDPEYIVGVLNAYFSEAVEVVIKYKGYIDKFIGDCIMAAWGIPLQTVQEDAIQAVSCALTLQEMVASSTRKFFVGEAAALKIGIGMHTGPIVAGNLGSARRMNYTVIGDTVNVAARLEGVAKAGEVIITDQTRSYLEDRFKLEKREPVKVKGKAEAIPIYRVVKRLK